MKFVLIMFMLHTWGGGSSSAEFANEAACEAAGKAYQAMFAPKYNPKKELDQRPWLRLYICVPYGKDNGGEL